MRTITVDGIECKVHTCEDCPCFDSREILACRHPLNSKVFDHHTPYGQYIWRKGGEACREFCPLKESEEVGEEEEAVGIDTDVLDLVSSGIGNVLAAKAVCEISLSDPKVHDMALIQRHLVYAEKALKAARIRIGNMEGDDA